jgi:pyruvate formate lyase activating enzyme
MQIAGFQKNSFVDYPGQIAAVVFTPYCNFNCVYCHNDHILGKDTPLLNEDAIFSFLNKRAGVLGAVVVSGGEPTLQQNLEEFILRVRSLGYRVKLDTNGAKPRVLQKLLANNLLDYVAMDVKAPLCRYGEIANAPVDIGAVQKSIAILEESSVPHEFRLTFAPQLTQNEAVEAAMLVKGCERFFLQQYRPRNGGDLPAHPPQIVRETADRISDAIGVCKIRGIGPES